MKYLKYLIDIQVFSTEALGQTGHHFLIKLFSCITFGVNYLPMQFAYRLNFFTRFFNTIEFESAILLWKRESSEEREIKMKMYDA